MPKANLKNQLVANDNDGEDLTQYGNPKNTTPLHTYTRVKYDEEADENRNSAPFEIVTELAQEII